MHSPGCNPRRPPPEEEPLAARSDNNSGVSGLAAGLGERLTPDARRTLIRFAAHHAGWDPDELLVDVDLATGRPTSVLMYFDSANPMAELAAAEAPPAPQGLASYWNLGAYVQSPGFAGGVDLVGNIAGEGRMVHTMDTCPVPVDAPEPPALQGALRPVVRCELVKSSGAWLARAIEYLLPPRAENSDDAEQVIAAVAGDVSDPAVVQRLLAKAASPRQMVVAIKVDAVGPKRATMSIGARLNGLIPRGACKRN
jgi:hypothetical protein